MTLPSAEPKKILVVEDDPKTATSIRLYLEREGFETLVAHGGRRALELARSESPDLLVLDLMLPEVDGYEVCRALRSESSVPIVMLTARTTEEDTLRGLDLGADDYIAKPFSPRELVARVRAVLRRAHTASANVANAALAAGDLRVDLHAHTATSSGRPLQLTPAEFRLLEAFVRSPGRAFTRRELAERALGWDFDGFDRTVDAHVKNLRKKLGPGALRIRTVYGVGYKLGGDDDAR
jgi:DNA-binding response OmpR family regulator